MDTQLVGLDDKVVPTRTAASLLELDPELGEGLSADQAASAHRLVVSVQPLAVGPWDPETIERRRRSAFGVLILDGLVAREVAVAGGGALELLGPGDIVYPWVDDETDMLPIGSAWEIVGPGRIAVFEPRSVAGLCAAPPVLEAVVKRFGHRATRLAVHQAISQLPRVEQRILTLLWYLAERWGHVSADGVVLALPLSHGAIGRLIGARRPTVSLAIKELVGQHLLARHGNRAWVLVGDPPEDLARVRPAQRRERTVELRPLEPPIAALAERLVALRGRYTHNLHIARTVIARSEATRADARRLITRPRPLAPAQAPPRPARRG